MEFKLSKSKHIKTELIEGSVTLMDPEHLRRFRDALDGHRRNRPDETRSQPRVPPMTPNNRDELAKGRALPRVSYVIPITPESTDVPRVVELPQGTANQGVWKVAKDLVDRENLEIGQQATLPPFFDDRDDVVAATLTIRLQTHPIVLVATKVEPVLIVGPIFDVDNILYTIKGVASHTECDLLGAHVTTQRFIEPLAPLFTAWVEVGIRNFFHTRF